MHAADRHKPANCSNFVVWLAIPARVAIDIDLDSEHIHIFVLYLMDHCNSQECDYDYDSILLSLGLNRGVNRTMTRKKHTSKS